MKSADIYKTYTPETLPADQTDWERLRNLPDEAITDDPPPFTEAQWASATFRRKGVRMTRAEFHAAAPPGENVPAWLENGAAQNALSRAAASPQNGHAATPPLAPDLAEAFPTWESVNDALRLLLRIRRDLQNVAP